MKILLEAHSVAMNEALQELLTEVRSLKEDMIDIKDTLEEITDTLK